MNISETLSDELRSQIQNFVRGPLIAGRGDWNWMHTQATACHVQNVCTSLNIAPKVPETAAWFHDVGYTGLLSSPDQKNYDKLKGVKDEHMTAGAKITKEYLSQAGIKSYFTNGEIKRVVHLVETHDQLETLRDPDEIALMEADTLGAIDLKFVTPSFDSAGRKKYLQGLRTRREPLFMSEYGKRKLEELLPQFETFNS